MRVVFLLANDTSLRIPPLRSDRHRAACHAPRTDEISDLGLRFPSGERPLEILAPEDPLALARKELQVIREIFPGAELVVCASMLGQATDDELAASRGSG
jgi:hypothetical protein